MSTTAIAAPSAGLTRSRRIVLGFALFSIAGTGVVTLAPAIAAQQGSGGQPSFEVIAATGAALILLAGLFLGYVGRVLGLGRAWLLMAVVSNGALLVYRFVVVPVSMYKTTFYLGFLSSDPNQPGTVLSMAVASALALAATVVVARFLFGHPHIPSGSAERRRFRRSVVLPIVIALGVALPFIGVCLLVCVFGAMFELGTVVTVTGAFLPCWLGALWLLATPGAFTTASWRAGEVRDVTVVTTFLWVALALLLIVHILWVVYMGVLVHLLPFKTVAPTGK
jgi:energy-converting hydrogenase Eha subunit A